MKSKQRILFGCYAMVLADYANGRDVRNYFEKVIRTRAYRLSPILDELTVEQFRTIELVDLEKAKEMKSSNW